MTEPAPWDISGERETSPSLGKVEIGGMRGFRGGISVAKKSITFFLYAGSSMENKVLVDFNFIQNPNFVRLYCDSCHISVHF